MRREASLQPSPALHGSALVKACGGRVQGSSSTVGEQVTEKQHDVTRLNASKSGSVGRGLHFKALFRIRE